MPFFGLVNANIANIAPDDTAVGGKPWTSKHIVDMLCPPIEETGNPVQCYPVPGYPLGITASWEPVQEGEGDPSPDNIRPIKGRDSVTVERCGKNLLKTSGVIWNSSTSGYYYFTRDANDKGKNIYVHLIASVQYSLYADGNNNVNIFAKTEAQTKNTQIGTLTSDGSTASCTFSVDESGDYTIWAWYDKPLDIPPYNNPMLCVGEPQKSEYVPYQGDTVTIALPETIYGGYVDAVTGEGESQYKKVNIRTENLNYNINISAMLGYASKNLLNDIQLPSSNSIAFDGVCDCLPTKSASEINSGVIGFGVSASGDIYLKSEGLDSAEAYAAKFQNGVNVCYKVATPTSFSATGNAPVKALSGVNTVLTDADSAEVTGREDLLHVLSGLQASE